MQTNIVKCRIYRFNLTEQTTNTHNTTGAKKYVTATTNEKKNEKKCVDDD